MLAKVNSAALYGIDALRVEVEIDLASGLPQLATVGLPEGAVKESKDRIRAAVKNCGYTFPAKRITINLAPADIKKEGSAYDLPMAIGILAAEGSFEKTLLDAYLLIGELSLDGTVKPVRGALSIAMAAKKEKFRGMILPEQNASEAAVVKEVEVLGVRDLPQVVEFLNGSLHINRHQANLDDLFNQHSHYNADFNDVKGQQHVKARPGSRRRRRSQRHPGWPARLGKNHAGEKAADDSPRSDISRSAGNDQDSQRHGIAQRPSDHRHPAVSLAAPHDLRCGLVGGGTVPKPGEVSLAHNGVLFLDELPEFQSQCPGSHAPASRRRQHHRFAGHGFDQLSRKFHAGRGDEPLRLWLPHRPAEGMHLHAAANPTLPLESLRPALDRIDIQVEVPGLRYQELASKDAGESSNVIRQRVNDARKIQLQRFDKTKLHANAQMGTREIKRYCAVKEDAEKLLETAINKLGLSARAYSRVSESRPHHRRSRRRRKHRIRRTSPKRFSIEAWIGECECVTRPDSNLTTEKQTVKTCWPCDALKD